MSGIVNDAVVLAPLLPISFTREPYIATTTATPGNENIRNLHIRVRSIGKSGFRS